MEIKAKENQMESTEESPRILSIDVFKGLSITLMTFVNSLAFFENVPPWTKHAGDYGLTYVDLIAPFFIFMLALNFTLSFKKRVEIYGRKKAYLRFVRRYVIFIAIGLVLFLEVDADTFVMRWGTLQVLGTAGLIHLSIAELKSIYRLIIGTVLLILHQIMLLTDLSFIIYDGIEGGLIGSLSWASMMIFSSMISDAIWKEKRSQHFFLGGLIFILSGVLTGIFFGISRAYMSLPYVLISVGASSLVYYTIYLIFDIASVRWKMIQQEQILSGCGKNAFSLYIIHLLLISIEYELIPLDIEWILVLSIAIVNVVFILVVGFIMDKFKIYLVI